jgi:hypothetical protein
MSSTSHNFRRFRNPRRPWRIAAASCAYAIPGALAGGMAAMILGRALVCALLGLALGAVCGAWLESHTSS